MKTEYEIHAVRQDGLRASFQNAFEHYPTPDEVRACGKITGNLPEWQDCKFVIVQVDYTDISSYDSQGKQV